MKKLAVTGHTKRIGKAIYDAFPNSIGLSKSTGYDITDKNSRTRILHAVRECDVFINNAHDGFGQVELLNDLFTSWKDEEKLIINIGVDTVPYTNWQVVHQQYPVEKVALHSQSELLQNQAHRCRVTTLGLGHVDTEFNKYYDGAKLSYTNIIDIIKWIIDQPFEVKQLMVSAK